MESKDLMITIPQERYDKFISEETRINVAVEYITNNEYAKPENILSILGTVLALQKADEIREEKKMQEEECIKRLDGQQNAGL